MIRRLLSSSLFLLLAACGPAETAQAPLAPPPPAVVAEAAPAVPVVPVAESAQAPAPSPEAPAPSDRVLLFFLNPAGRPCQAQKAILDGMGAGLTDKAALRYVSVQDPSSRDALYTYGIRALPSLILVDAAGQELHRFTPGIHEADDILSALQ